MTDAEGCTATKTVTVTEPVAELQVNATAGTISCHGGTTTVTVTATGGVPPYNGTGTFVRDAGFYLFLVTDANGCISFVAGYISQPNSLSATVAAPVIPCNATNTTVTVNASGGTAPYSGTGSFTRGPGTWTFTITDSKGCTTSKTITIANPVCGPVEEDKCYKIVNRNGGKGLSANNSSATAGSKVKTTTIGSSPTNEPIWKFEVASGANGFYRIINQASTYLSLEAKNGTTSNDGEIILDPYTNANFQKWKLTATGNYFFITPQHYTASPNNWIVVKDASTGNNKPVVINGRNIPNGSYPEQWQISEVGCPAMARPGSAPVIVQQEENENTEDEEVVELSDFSVHVSPNPGVGFFNIKVTSRDVNTLIEYRILNIDGKVLSVQKIKANSVQKINSENWAAGIYFAEVVQCGQRKVVKLIKTN